MPVERNRESPRLSVLAPIEVCQIVLYAPMFFVKVTLYSVDVYEKQTLTYGDCQCSYTGTLELTPGKIQNKKTNKQTNKTKKKV